MQTDNDFSTPILSSLYCISSAIILIAGIISLVMCLSAGNFNEGIVIGFSSILVSLFFYGIAQITTAICKTAYLNQKMLTQLIMISNNLSKLNSTIEYEKVNNSDILEKIDKISESTYGIYSVVYNQYQQ